MERCVSTTVLISNAFSANSLAANPILFETDGFSIKKLIASAKASAFFVGTSKPVSFGLMASLHPG